MKNAINDIREYSDKELSLNVFNIEPLYRIRHCYSLAGVLNELYKFTNEQWDVLIGDLEEDKKDNTNETR